MFFAKRKTLKSNCFYVTDVVTDFYFVLISWLYENYPDDSDGIPSKDAINNVYQYFENLSAEEKHLRLKSVLTKKKRNSIEKQIYTTYKSAGYYINLSKNKLHFVDSDNNPLFWNEDGLIRSKRTHIISSKDRRLYVTQILRYDACLFLSMCLLNKYCIKSNLKYEDIVFQFIHKYYPIKKFDFIHLSIHNYFDVRKHWLEILNLNNDKGTVSPLIKSIVEQENLNDLYCDINNNIIEFRKEINTQKKYLQEKSKFYKVYKRLSLKQAKSNDFINLYDILEQMDMSYKKFCSFISEFYELERKKKNIFFINIVSTIDQRKRFFVRGIPVLKIKIS